MGPEEAAEVFAEVERRNNLRIRKFFPDEGPYRRALYPKHVAFMRAGKRHRERLFLKANRVGGPQPHDEPVLTPQGFRPMGDIHPGDRVIAGDGSQTVVLGRYPQGVRPVLRIAFSDGSWTRCDETHLWRVRHIGQGRGAPYRDIAAGVLYNEVRAGRRYALPERPVADLAPRESLPVDPYLLGLLLGDGGMSQISTFITTTDPEIVDYCRDIAPAYGCELRGGASDTITYWFATTRKRGGRWHNALADLLEMLGVRVHGGQKRVPPSYLVASADDRLALLQGLMDTDGTCGQGKAAGRREFYSASRGLCEDVAALARSLGINALVRQKYDADHGKNLVACWIAYLPLGGPSVFRLPRKRERERQAVSPRGVVIESIERDGEAECSCLAVAHPSGMYLTRDYLPTHNTEMGAFEITLHLTGRYDDYAPWWEGRRFDGPIKAWVAGDTGKTTRDILQFKLFGKPEEPGTGMVPSHLIAYTTAKAGLADGYDSVYVRHVSGRLSLVQFKSFDQGRRSFQGTEQHVVWLDEECPQDVYGECLMRTAATGEFPGGMVMLTFTPLNGLTPLILDWLPGGQLPETVA